MDSGEVQCVACGLPVSRESIYGEVDGRRRRGSFELYDGFRRPILMYAIAALGKRCGRSGGSSMMIVKQGTIFGVAIAYLR